MKHLDLLLFSEILFLDPTLIIKYNYAGLHM